MGYSGEMLLEFQYIILFTYYMYIFKLDLYISCHTYVTIFVLQIIIMY